MKHPRTWYVITDGGRARIVQKRDAQDAFDTHREFVSADIHRHTHELGMERPGRTHESASSAHHALQPREDLHRADKRDFVYEIARGLNDANARDEFDRLILRSSGARARGAESRAQCVHAAEDRGSAAEGAHQCTERRSREAPFRLEQRLRSRSVWILTKGYWGSATDPIQVGASREEDHQSEHDDPAQALRAICVLDLSLRPRSRHAALGRLKFKFNGVSSIQRRPATSPRRQKNQNLPRPSNR